MVEKVIVMGVGNLLCSDEGFGVHVVRFLESMYDFPPEVELFDGGTLGMAAAYKIGEASHLIIIDVLDVEGVEGDIRVFSKDDVMLSKIPVKLSPHQIGVQEVLLMCEMHGICPGYVKVIGVIPGSLEPGMELTDSCLASVETVADMVISEVSSFGLTASVVALDRQ